MSEYIHKSHNVTVLMYHLVFPAKYRRAVFDETVEHKLRDICLDIEKCYEVKFLEIGTDENHVHLLVPSIARGFNSLVQSVGQSQTIPDWGF